MRLHELAKEIGVSSKELLALSREIGLNIKSHSSNLAAGEESILRFAMKQELEEQAAKEASKREAEAAAAAEKEEAVRAEAAMATMKIAAAIMQTHPDKAKPAMNKLLAVSQDGDLRKQAEEIIRQIEESEDNTQKAKR